MTMNVQCQNYARSVAFSLQWASLCPQSTGLPWGLNFRKKLCESHRILIPTEPRNPPYPYPTPCVFSLDAFLNKHIYAVHVTMLLCVFSNDNEEKNCSERNYKLDCIWRNSNSDCDICRVFNAFPLISRVWRETSTCCAGVECVKIYRRSNDVRWHNVLYTVVSQSYIPNISLVSEGIAGDHVLANS